MAMPVDSTSPAHFIRLSKQLDTTRRLLTPMLTGEEMGSGDFIRILKMVSRIRNGVKQYQKIHFPKTRPWRIMEREETRVPDNTPQKEQQQEEAEASNGLHEDTWMELVSKSEEKIRQLQGLFKSELALSKNKQLKNSICYLREELENGIQKSGRFGYTQDTSLELPGLGAILIEIATQSENARSKVRDNENTIPGISRLLQEYCSDMENAQELIRSCSIKDPRDLERFAKDMKDKMLLNFYNLMKSPTDDNAKLLSKVTQDWGGVRDELFAIGEKNKQKEAEIRQKKEQTKEKNDKKPEKSDQKQQKSKQRCDNNQEKPQRNIIHSGTILEHPPENNISTDKTVKTRASEKTTPRKNPPSKKENTEKNKKKCKHGKNSKKKD